MPTSEHLETKYPNIVALAHGCISGKTSEWVALKPEAEKILEEVDRHAHLVTTIETLRAQLKKLQEINDELRNALIEVMEQSMEQETIHLADTAIQRSFR